MTENACHPAAWSRDRLYAECDVRFQRRSGPGGQHRNKVSTAVALQHLPTGVKAEASERRSQAENLATALFRLRLNLALHFRMVRDTGSHPTELWRSRCRGGRIEISPSHDAFPSLLAEALDTIASCDYDVNQAATRLDCSMSQLVRLLKKEPQAMLWVNQQRTSRGLHALH